MLRPYSALWIAIALTLPLSATPNAAPPLQAAQAAESNKAEIAAESDALYSLGVAHLEAGDYAAALPVLEAGLLLVAANPDENAGTASDLSNSPKANDVINFSTALGQAHQWLGHLGSALNYYQQALAGGALLNESVRAVLLVNAGTVEAEVGQYDQAELTLQQAVDLNDRLENKQGKASAILSLGWLYERQDEFDRAITHYRQAIALYQQIGNLPGEADTINNLGLVHLKQGDLEAARKALDRGWSLLQTEEDVYTRSLLLNSYGQFFQAEGNLNLAWSRYLQGLALSADSEDAISEIIGFLNLAVLMEKSRKPNLAIFFYKVAITKIEIIRHDLKGLSDTVQQRYTATVEDFYRTLADLLLQQNRTTEALQVLELLKLQEVRAYFHRDQTSQDVRDDGVQDNRVQDNRVQDNRPVSLYTSAEADLKIVLTDLLTGASALESSDAVIGLSDFLQLPEARSVASQVSATGDFFDLRVIESLQLALSAQPTKTAALYPLVLSDRIELILITAEGLPTHHSVDVSKAQLTQTVGQLQSQLSADSLDPTATAQRLYRWLVAPLDRHLETQSIESIIYLPDSILRYIPLAALHDGQQWLAQKYQSHNITAASIDDLTQLGAADLTVVAGALTEASPTHRVNVGQEQFPFNGLPGAKQEVDRLATLMPNTVTLLDQSFTPQTLLDEAGSHNIVHLATHAKFLPGQPENSFVLFGDGSIVTMRELGEWRLPGVELVVFSACQTATSVDGEGKEILGLGFQMQQTGADSAIASLWAVDDIATAALMNQFYIALKEGKSKAQALQQAQTRLINSRSFSHPHDWAAFILIGNGL
ncbi:MAG: CHAT domain-containing protein [Cyanobacteria bacterium P01_D01_bin.1]